MNKPSSTFSPYNPPLAYAESILEGAEIFSLGGSPGCGKGTLVKHVIRPWCIENNRPLFVLPISAEIVELLDTHPPEDAAYVRRLMKEGYLVPDAVANGALRSAVDKVERVRNALYVLDGAGRTFGQQELALIQVPKMLGIAEGNRKFLRFTTAAHVCGYRACDRKREDDTEESFRVRWDEYVGKTAPAIHAIVSNAGAIGVNVIDIDGAYVRASPALYRDLIFGRPNGSLVVA